MKHYYYTATNGRIWCVVATAMLLFLCVGVNAQEDSEVRSQESEVRSQESDSSRVDSSKVEIVAIKNNLFYDAAATMNLQLEFRLTDKWSLEFGVGLNPFPVNDMKFPKWRHLSVSVDDCFVSVFVSVVPDLGSARYIDIYF